jgi:hypothetical protein
MRAHGGDACNLKSGCRDRQTGYRNRYLLETVTHVFCTNAPFAHDSRCLRRNARPPAESAHSIRSPQPV